MAEKTKKPAGRETRLPPIIAPGHTFETVTDHIAEVVLQRRTPRGWFIGFAIAFAITMVMLMSITYLLLRGIGVWGVNVPVGWGFAIINFVWWIGIGHAGTLISAMEWLRVFGPIPSVMLDHATPELCYPGDAHDAVQWARWQRCGETFKSSSPSRRDMA